MAEYWKSAPRYWCKQCKIYIRDTAFEKSQHEATGKHQGNLKRFLRDIHRDNEKQQRDSERAKNEVERLRQTVSGGGSGSGAASSSGGKRTATAQATPAPPAESTGRPISMDERKKQMAQLAEMGVSIPEEFRGDMSLAGEWQTTSVRVIEPENEDGTKGEKGKSGVGIGVRKRKLEGHEDDEDGEHGPEPGRFVSKTWGQRMKEYPGAQGAGDDEDLDALLESTKNVKKVRPSEPDEKKEETGDAPDQTQGKDGDDGSTDVAPNPEETSQVKEEGPASAVKGEPAEPESGVVFKKRKPKTIRK